MLYSRLIGRSIRRRLIWWIDGQRSGNEGGWRMLGSLDLAAALLIGAAGLGKLRAPQPAVAILRQAVPRALRAPPVVGMTTTLLLVETVILAVLCVLVAGLLRAYGTVLRRLHQLDGGAPAADGPRTFELLPVTPAARPAAAVPELGPAHDVAG